MPRVGYKQSEEHKKKHRNKIPWNKGKVGLQIPWNKGKVGLQIGYNKGINRILSQSYKEWLKNEKPKVYCECPCRVEIIIKEHHKWHGIPKYIQGHHSRVNNPFKDKHCSKEHKEKISNENKGKISINKGKCFSDISRKRMSDSAMNKHNLEKNASWKGGISFEPYCIKFNEKKKEEVREQYNRKCVICGIDEKDNITKTNKLIKLSVHHIDEDKEQGCNGKPWNLKPLCMHCHGSKKMKNIKLEKII